MNKFGCYYKKNIFDWNLFYKFDLKFTKRCISAFSKPKNEKIIKNFIKIKKMFKIQIK